tara:strand:+ start:3335 stop:3535 length:201 start_codon:yes stop_codon:yes gene_type:complete
LNLLFPKLGYLLAQGMYMRLIHHSISGCEEIRAEFHNDSASVGKVGEHGASWLFAAMGLNFVAKRQ